MRILIDILHPAHVHFFRHFRTGMLEHGHDVLVTSRAKDVTVPLLDAFAIPHEVLSSQQRGPRGLAMELVRRTSRLIRIARQFRPDVMTGIMGPSIAPAGKALRIPSVVFYDTELASVTNRWVYPLASAVCTPDSYAGKVRGKHFTYAGYQELAYLHPRRFQPDVKKLAGFGLKPPYSIVRFVSWEASHDVRASGLATEEKFKLVEKLEEHGRVVVSSEGALPRDLETHRLVGPLSEIHHVLAFADVFVGESGTMSTEAAVLGTPSVLIWDRTAGVFEDNERRYGLLRRLSPRNAEGILQAAIQAFASSSTAEARQQLLAEKVDVTSWMESFFAKRAWLQEGSRLDLDGPS